MEATAGLVTLPARTISDQPGVSTPGISTHLPMATFEMLRETLTKSVRLSDEEFAYLLTFLKEKIL